jgi:hypothetical protein
MTRWSQRGASTNQDRRDIGANKHGAGRDDRRSSLPHRYASCFIIPPEVIPDEAKNHFGAGRTFVY